MKNDVWIKNGIVIPDNEIQITASRAGGPGGQHVNKASTRVTVRWNVQKTAALSDEQKARVLQKLQVRLTKDGDLIFHHSTSRSQQKNKEMALARLAHEVRKALHLPKKRIPTRIPKEAKESRLRAKTRRGRIKKMRGKKIQENEKE